MSPKQVISRSEESDLLYLQQLYSRYGYSKFRMSKFEDYSLYLQNKDFLKGGNIVTFNGPDGRLLALKQDITLSIIKNALDERAPHRLYYVENVYRASDDTNDIREIPQAGVEYIGRIDTYVLSEVILLALESLAGVSDNYLLGLSHMGLLRGLLERTNLRISQRREILNCLQNKAAHEIRRICRENDVDESLTDKLCTLSTLFGSPDICFPVLRSMAVDDATSTAVEELIDVYELLRETGHEKNLRIDFSVANDMKYYNGITFQGFVDGTPCSVLSGGRYDDLMRKFGRKSDAIGFAVYLDLLQVSDGSDENKESVLVLYDSSDVAGLAAAVQSLQKDHRTIHVLQQARTGAVYTEVYQFKEGRLSLL